MAEKRRFVIRSREIAERAAEFVRNLPVQDPPYAVVAEPYKGRRSLGQNDYLHKLLRDIADFTGDDIESIKLEMKMRFLEPIRFVQLPDGTQYPIYPSTKKMTKAECATFCEMIEAFAIRELGFVRMVV